MGFQHAPQGSREEVVCRLKLVQVHEVRGEDTRVLEEGPLLLLRQSDRPEGLDLQVGSEKWLLHWDVPVLKVGERTYTLASKQPGLFYTIIIADGVPETDLVGFEQLLRSCTAFEVGGAAANTNFEQAVDAVERSLAEKDGALPPPPTHAAPTVPQPAKVSMADRIASGTLSAQSHIAAGATWLGSKIEQQGKYWEQRTSPNTQPTNVSPGTLKALRYTSGAVRGGANVAGQVVTGVANATASAADYVVRRLSPRGMRAPPDPNSKRGIAAAAVVSAVDLYESMEHAGRRVLDSTSRATTSFVSHKYGPDAGVATHHAGAAAVDAGMATWSVSRIGVRTVAKQFARRVAVGVARTHVGTSNNNINNMDASARPQQAFAPS